MARLRKLLTLATIACLMAVDVVSAQTLGRYNTALLSEIATKAKLSARLDTLGEGVYIDLCKVNGKSVTAIVRTGRVEHVGYSVFSAEQRTLSPSPIYNFLERYALQMDFADESTYSVEKQMEMDQVTFKVGSLASLTSLLNDSTLSVSITNHEERAYAVEWTRGNKVVCSVFFPASFELMHGSKMIENENMLQAKVKAQPTTVPDSAETVVTLADVVRPDSVRGDFYVLCKGHNRIAAMTADVYYAPPAVDTDTLTLLFSTDFPIESMANLFCANSITNNYVADVKLRKYNFQKELFSVPFAQLMNFFASENCVPFFGVVSYDAATGLVDAVVQMRNRELAYEHLLRVQMDTNTIPARSGHIAITLTSYIPTHNIKNLYADDEAH